MFHKKVTMALITMSLHCSLLTPHVMASDVASGIENTEQDATKKERMDNFLKQVPMIQDYIQKIKEKGLTPKAVFGVVEDEDGVARFDESWIFIDIDHNDQHTRSLNVSFNDLDELQNLANYFPNTFQTIAFDAEVPTYLHNFTTHHLKAIHGALAMNGEFWLPFQYAFDKAMDFSSPTSVDMEKAKNSLLNSIPLNSKTLLVDPIIKVPSALYDNEEFLENLMNIISENNHERLLRSVFGDENLITITNKNDRTLPFPENVGRLTNPPYVHIFKATKTSNTDAITVDELTQDDRNYIENDSQDPIDIAEIQSSNRPPATNVISDMPLDTVPTDTFANPETLLEGLSQDEKEYVQLWVDHVKSILWLFGRDASRTVTTPLPPYTLSESVLPALRQHNARTRKRFPHFPEFQFTEDLKSIIEGNLYLYQFDKPNTMIYDLTAYFKNLVKKQPSSTDDVESDSILN